MANERRLNQLIEDDLILLPRADLFASRYFGAMSAKWFYFDFGVDIPILTSSATEIDVQIINIGDPGHVKIELIEQAPSTGIGFGRLTYDLLQQIKNKIYDGQFIAGIALSVGISDAGENLILLELYIKQDGARVIISRDGGGGDNLTPTSIPPRK